MELRDAVGVGNIVHERNYIADEILCELPREIGDDPDNLHIDRTDQFEIIRFDDRSSGASRVSTFESGGNIVDPNAVPAPNWRERDFHVEDSVAQRIGFVQIPFETIGLFIDEYRTELPDPKPLIE